MRLRACGVVICMLLWGGLQIPSCTAGHWDSGLGLTVAGFEPVNAGESYDLIYGSAGLQVGLLAFWMNDNGLSLDAAYEIFITSGERVAAGSGDGSGENIDLTITSILLTLRYHIRPFANHSPFFGIGFGSYTEEEEWTSGGDQNSTRDRNSGLGYHLEGGVQFFRQSPVCASVSIRWNTVPDMIGKAGASEYYGESDIGGIAVRASICFALLTH